MGKPVASMNLTARLRLSDQRSTGPRAVFDQSLATISLAISPPPAATFCDPVRPADPASVCIEIPAPPRTGYGHELAHGKRYGPERANARGQARVPSNEAQDRRF